jgi:glutamine phosphoribosylpyrophosphate amidotransferase
LNNSPVRAAGWEFDLVCPVPDGSRAAAIQISSDLKIPYREGLVKNRREESGCIMIIIYDVSL